MKYGWMVYPKSTIDNPFGNNAFEWMIESAGKYGIKLDIILIDDLFIEISREPRFIYQGEKLSKPDFALMRCYDRILGHQLENMGVNVINRTEAMFISQNKILTGQLLVKNNIPTPKTLFAQNPSYEMISGILGSGRFVMKDVLGLKGENVYLVENEDDLNANLQSTNVEFLYQEFIQESSGKDIRVYVLGDKVLGCVMRKAKSGFKSNYSLGGTVESYDLNDEIRDISLKSAMALGLEFCGIDLLFGKNGLTVCEINGNAGFRTICQATNLDIGAEIFKYVDRKLYQKK